MHADTASVHVQPAGLSNLHVSGLAFRLFDTMQSTVTSVPSYLSVSLAEGDVYTSHRWPHLTTL